MSKSINKVYKSYDLANKGYSIIRMDGEQVIYKDYKDFDIEVSGLDNYREKRIDVRIYVWYKRIMKIIKSIRCETFTELNDNLYIIENSYLEEIMERKFKDETIFFEKEELDL